MGSIRQELPPVSGTREGLGLVEGFRGDVLVWLRTDNARGPAVAPDGSAVYYVVPLQNLNGLLDYELRAARPEDGPSKLLARISGERVPIWQGLHPVISKDGKWLVTGRRVGDEYLGDINC